MPRTIFARRSYSKNEGGYKLIWRDATVAGWWQCARVRAPYAPQAEKFCSSSGTSRCFCGTGNSRHSSSSSGTSAEQHDVPNELFIRQRKATSPTHVVAGEE